MLPSSLIPSAISIHTVETFIRAETIQLNPSSFAFGFMSLKDTPL